MERKGLPLLSRDVAKIVIGARDVTVEDINELTGRDFRELGRAPFAEAYQTLSKRLNPHWEVADIAKRICGRPTDSIARFFYDPFLADRERLQVSREHPSDSFEIFIHNMVARVIKREMDVGMLVLAPNHPDGNTQFYYVSGKLVSGEGMVSYILHPATTDTNLEPIRLFRGTSPRNSDLDGIFTIITDLEKDLGRSAYESGLIYEPRLQERFMQPVVEAGHSMGSTVVQYRLANMNHIRKAYLFCGPGVPETEAEKFNQKNPSVDLIIRHSTKDKWSNVGQIHLGYQAPSNVELDFRKYHTPRKKGGRNPHVVVWPKEKVHYGIEGGLTPAMIDAELNHKNQSREKIRSAIGPWIGKMLRSARDVSRSLFTNRTDEQRGLKIGHMQNGRWQVDHFCIT